MRARREIVPINTAAPRPRAYPVPREPLVLFKWEVSSYFGWGVYGLNLLLAWADRTDLLPAAVMRIDPAALDVDPLERRRLEPAIRRSADLQAELRRAAGRTATTSRLVLQPVQNGLEPVRAAHDVDLRGSPSIGVAFLEQARFSPAAASRLRDYPLVVAGSNWNRHLLHAAGASNVALVHQGVDTSLFHPAPGRGLFPGRFVVFSGGKLEYRKGQDLVLGAFRRFAERHPEALLLTAWSSPWPQLARSLGANRDLVPPPLTAEGQVDVAGWTRLNGLSEHQVVHCGSVANRAMPRILREAAVALFPNRAEGGTNLVAMECMACGVPVILSANTGHLDLLGDDTAVALRRQAVVPQADYEGWGDSDPDEMVEALESVHANPDAAAARAERGAALVGGMTWAAQMGQLATLLRPFIT
jgi:glycosyltransferase involved in cell wall biosynthesis